MLDLTSDKGRLISAAFGLAAERRWSEITLADIAERAGSTLFAIRQHFASKGELLAAFSRMVDDEMLRRATRRAENQQPRDALFEVVMSRFDVLEPYKGALKSIAASGLPEPALIAPLMATPGWMLEAAGINSGGIGGHVRTAGLASIYASVFQTWLGDDDSGLARTMAALDRRLRRGQRTLERVEDACSGLGRVASALVGAVRAGAKRSPSSGNEPAQAPATPPAQPGT